LQRAGGRMEEAARLVGMSRATFWRKRKKYGLR
jgi:transcriptional regulator of acetoin/glycerol metabolism